jgi:hypothetical protein
VIVDQEPFKVPAKSKMRLLIALEAVKYYQMVSRDVTAATMMWPALKNFYEQWEALESRAKLDKPDVPKLNKGMSVPKWASNMEVFLRGIIGARTAPMAYLIRPEGAVATPAPALMPSQPHSAEHGSIEEEFIARTSHNHALFRNDDGELYGLLQVVLRGTPFESSIASGRKRREGRKSYNSVISQHAGRDVYEKLIREAELYLKTKTWDGRGGITLVKHTTRHRKSYLDLEDANYHVPTQLPNNRSRVTYLLDSITCKDPDMLAAIAAIKQDETGKRSDFEDATAFLIPNCPVAKKAEKHNNVGANIGAAEADLGAGRGKSGVALRYHKYDEFHALNQDQREELKAWRAKNRGDSPPNAGKKRKAGESSNDKKAKKKFKTMVSSVEKKYGALSKAMEAFASKPKCYDFGYVETTFCDRYKSPNWSGYG